MDFDKIKMRDLIFASHSLEELAVVLSQASSSLTPDSPWFFFKEAYRLRNLDETVTARDALWKILKMSGLETRLYLWAWNGLRELGEKPPESMARQIQGVVLEVPMPIGLDVLSAYKDGTARYINYSGAGIIWDTPDETSLLLVDTLISQTKQIMPLMERLHIGDTASPKVVRLSALTYSGIYQIESISGSDDEEDETIRPAFILASKLLAYLVNQTKKHPPEQQ